MKLAILLTEGFEYQNRRTVLSLADGALPLGHEVGIFLMGDGVYAASSLGVLSDRGAEVVWCSHNAAERGSVTPTGVCEGSQLDWASMVAQADRVVSFG